MGSEGDTKLKVKLVSRAEKLPIDPTKLKQLAQAPEATNCFLPNLAACAILRFLVVELLAMLADWVRL